MNFELPHSVNISMDILDNAFVHPKTGEVSYCGENGVSNGLCKSHIAYLDKNMKAGNASSYDTYQFGTTILNEVHNTIATVNDNISTAYDNLNILDGSISDVQKNIDSMSQMIESLNNSKKTFEDKFKSIEEGFIDTFGAKIVEALIEKYSRSVNRKI